MINVRPANNSFSLSTANKNTLLNVINIFIQFSKYLYCSIILYNIIVFTGMSKTDSGVYLSEEALFLSEKL